MTPATPSPRSIPETDRSFRSRASGTLEVSPELRLDIKYCALLLVLTAIMVLPGSLTLPMELYDESRNAINAIEMAKSRDWLVTTYGYLPDHWNTKPPLLIWIVASLLRTGLDPMLALRLPSIMATMGSVLLVYLTCRVTIEDRLAGLLAGMMLTCSLLFMGDHVGRTGDYDALLSFLCLGYVLCAWRYIDAPADRSGRWIAASGLLLFLALMTKGVAAGMAVPGLLVYAIVRRPLTAILSDRYAWAMLICVSAGVTAWLLLREQRDPGYLAATLYNDVSGRYLTVLDDHAEGPSYYLRALFRAFEPAMLLLPTLLSVRRSGDPIRRQLCLLMTLAALSWLVTISFAGSKCYWYVAPAAPLLAIAAGVATATFLRRQEPPLSSLIVIRPMILTMLITVWYLDFSAPDASRGYGADQVWYGPFLNKVEDKMPLDGIVIVDRGLPNDAGFVNYNPVARFFTEYVGWRGAQVRLVASTQGLGSESAIASCDPGIRTFLQAQHTFEMILADKRCVLGRLLTSEGEAMKPAG
jgi:4-amino-4-deoxy-L-arabinose transferase-like glycosyltransferase